MAAPAPAPEQLNLKVKSQVAKISFRMDRKYSLRLRVQLN